MHFGHFWSIFEGTIANIATGFQKFFSEIYRVSQKKVCFRNEQLAALQTTAGPGSPADESKNGHFHVYL